MGDENIFRIPEVIDKRSNRRLSLNSAFELPFRSKRKRKNDTDSLSVQSYDIDAAVKKRSRRSLLKVSSLVNLLSPSKLSKMAANIEGRVLHDPEKRSIRGSDTVCNYSCHIGTANGVVQIYFDEEFRQDIQKGKNVVVSNTMPAGESFRLVNGKSLVFETNDLNVDENKISLFLNPPKMSVGDALTSPLKRKLSVVGYAYKILDSENRKFLKLSPTKVTSSEDASISVDVKLWGDASKRLKVETGSKICITNVTVGCYNGKKDLNSTILTNVECCEEEEDYTIEIKAIKWKRPTSVILTKGNESIEVDTYILERQCKVQFGELDIVGRCIMGIRQGSKIVTLEDVPQ